MTYQEKGEEPEVLDVGECTSCDMRLIRCVGPMEAAKRPTIMHRQVLTFVPGALGP